MATVSSLHIAEQVQPVPMAAKMKDEDYYIWCTSVVEGHDGNYHMLYSRWSKKLGFAAWVTDSEVAYAVAGNPLGPYRFQNVALPRRGALYWDGNCTHNPTVTRMGKKYYLYYMGTRGGQLEQRASLEGSDWWDYRNNQRIGVAVADHPQGPWLRYDSPIVDISPDPTAFDSLMVSNPSAASRPDGGMLLIYKAVIKTASHKGGVVRYGAAIAEKPEGPYIKQAGNIFEHEGEGSPWMVAEDPFLWYGDDRYYAVVRDVVGIFTGTEGALALFESHNGLDWQASAHPKVLGAAFQWEDGTWRAGQVERPQILLKQGKPHILFGAIDVNEPTRRAHSHSVFIPLDPKIGV
jgi:hypothetical protein